MDEATIGAACAGNRDARASLLAHLQDPWYRMCLSLLGDVERARDATQESGLRFLRQLPSFRGDSQLRTWALGIAINVAREMRRANRGGGELDADLYAAAESEMSPPASAELEERRQQLHATLGELPERQREAVVLRFFEEMSVEQTAEVMNCATGTVKATVHQALRSLRRKLSQLV